MKKIFAIALVAIAMFANTANAQVKFGVKGGLNLSELSLNNALGDTFNPENQTGFFVGPAVKLTLPIVGLSIDGAALYSQTGSKFDDIDVKSKSIAIPVNVRYGIGLSSIANVFAFAGPQFAFGIGDKDVKFSDLSNYSFKSSALSINLGIGATVASHLQVTANYNIPCGNAGDVNVRTAVDAAWTAIGNTKEKTWQVGLTYWF